MYVNVTLHTVVKWVPGLVWLLTVTSWSLQDWIRFQSKVESAYEVGKVLFDFIWKQGLKLVIRQHQFGCRFTGNTHIFSVEGSNKNTNLIAIEFVQNVHFPGNISSPVFFFFWQNIYLRIFKWVHVSLFSSFLHSLLFHPPRNPLYCPSPSTDYPLTELWCTLLSLWGDQWAGPLITSLGY